MDNNLRSVLITGCSTGIGRASARLLAERDFLVFAGVRCLDHAEAILDSKLPNLQPVLLDVTSEENVEAIVQDIAEACPNGLYAVVNNAGVGLPAAVELSRLDDVRNLFEVNTIAPLRIIQNCLPLLRKGNGRVVNISSMNGTMALPMVGAYSASKFALEALSDTLRVELRPWRIPVSIVRPGQVRTSIFDKARLAIERQRREIPEQLKDGYDRMYSRAAQFNERGAKSPTSPEKVAHVVLQALKARRPSPRYHVGIDAHGMNFANAVMPQRLIDRALARVMRVLHRAEDDKHRTTYLPPLKGEGLGEG
ncbi:MAG: SDR family oxidoreductase [Planctomycetota bacterium]